MRKAKITGCVAETVGSSMTIAAIGVAFKVGRYKRYAQVVFPIETVKTDIDRNINQKSELLMKYLMKYVRKELEHWNEGDADTTDLENIMRLKMPFLLRKAVNMEYFKQIFKRTMTNKEIIDRWAEQIIPAVFKAEDALKKAKPEWKERLAKLGQPGGEDPHKVADEYCREIATIIVRQAADYDTTDYSDHDPVDDL